MDIMVPVSETEQIEKYCQAGADELYFGFQDDGWDSKFGVFEEINRMSSFGSKANFRLGQIEEVVQIIRENGKKAYLTLNSPVYSGRQHRYIEDIIEQSFFSKLDGVIIGDPAVIDIVKGAGVPIILSTIAGGYNSLVVKFYKKLGVKRIIFPRDMRIEDMQKIVHTFPEMKFEVFIMRNGCKYSDAYCMSYHGRRYSSMCSCFDNSDTKFCFTDGCSQNFCRESYSNHKLFTKAFHKETCGLCFIERFYKMGISSVKIVGRADKSESVINDIINVRQIIDALDDGQEFVKSMGHYDNCLYGLNCYYH